MSALSSATSTSGAVSGARANDREIPPAGVNACALDASVAGSQRSASSTYGAAPMVVDANCRAAAIRSGGRCAVPVRIVTVNVVPRPSWLVDRDAAAMKTRQFLHEREPDARAFVRAGARVLDAVEALEDARQVGVGNADAGVAHARARRDRRATAARP